MLNQLIHPALPEYFFKYLFIYLFEGMRGRGYVCLHELGGRAEREREVERESQADFLLSAELDLGLNLMTLSS